MRRVVPWMLLAAIGLFAGAAAAQALAIVVADDTPLRAAPRDSGKTHALLWAGEALEVRGDRVDHLQVWDHRLERGGFVGARHLRRVTLDPASAPEILALVRFLRESPGAEPLGIAYAAAFLRAAPPAKLRGAEGAEALDALGTFADRLARRASSATTKAAQATLTGHLEVARQYGIVFVTHERDGRMTICYDGDAFRRVIDGRAATPEQNARAVLALTRPDCRPGALRPTERRMVDEESAKLVEALELQSVPAYLRNRVHMRAAVLWSAIAYQQARRGEPADPAGLRAFQWLARVDKDELTDEDAKAYGEAAARLNASRWTAVLAQGTPGSEELPHVLLTPGEPGETCVALVAGPRDATNPLARRCTYGIVWRGSATLNREHNALALAVQHTESWREMWLFRKSGKDWSVRVLPPAPSSPSVGYAELAGWVPGGKQMLVAREALVDGRLTRSFELLRLDSLAAVAKAPDPAQLPAFDRWQDPMWKRWTASLR